MTASHTAAPAILSYVAWQSPTFKGARVTMTGAPFHDDAEIELTAAVVADLHRDDAGTVDLLIVYGKDEEADEALISRQLLAAATTATASGALFQQRLDTFNAAHTAFLRVAADAQHMQQVLDGACDIAADAYNALIPTPAPTERAIIQKLDALYRWSADSEIPPTEIKTILADAARLRAVDRTAWDAAFAVMQQTKAEDDAVNAIYNAATPEEADAIEPEWLRLGDAADDAGWALFAIPAPDQAALLWKCERLFGASDGVNSSPCWRGDIIATYMADVRRFLSGEARA